jgi:hypothetical protein
VLRARICDEAYGTAPTHCGRLHASTEGSLRMVLILMHILYKQASWVAASCTCKSCSNQNGACMPHQLPAVPCQVAMLVRCTAVSTSCIPRIAADMRAHVEGALVRHELVNACMPHQLPAVPCQVAMLPGVMYCCWDVCYALHCCRHIVSPGMSTRHGLLSAQKQALTPSIVQHWM